jgi:hypothetical protein
MGDRSRRIGDAFPRRATARALQRLRQAAGQAAGERAEMLREADRDPARWARFYSRFVVFQGLAARKSFLRVAQPIRFARCGERDIPRARDTRRR